MNTVAWIILCVPVAFALGWVGGWFRGRAKYVEAFTEERSDRLQWQAESRRLRELLRRAADPITDDEFDRMLDRVASDDE